MEVETMQHQHHVAPSPSFRLPSNCSSETLADIAARVIEELRWDPNPSISDDEAILQPWENDEAVNDNDTNKNDDNSDDFEFTFVRRDPNTSPVSADDIFYNGHIKMVYPIFGRTLNDPILPIKDTNQNDDAEEIKRRRQPLRKLMFEERETSSCSSSTDKSLDLEGVAEGTYCVWNPHSVGVKDRKKKISSTGSVSKRWKLRNLVQRSQSEGKEKVSEGTNMVANEAEDIHDNGGALVRAVKDKRKSFLPFKQELFGLFTPVK